MTEVTSYQTLAQSAYGEFKDRGSRFLAYAYPFQVASDLKNYLEPLQKEHFKAVHHCFAYKIGMDGNDFRLNDDGEPSGSAARPIMGQIDAFGLTDTLIIVVRYFGGTLLGVPGLIRAYKEASAAALNHANIVTREITLPLVIECDYPQVNEVLRVIERTDTQVIQREFGMNCRFEVALPLVHKNAFMAALGDNYLINLKQQNVNTFDENKGKT